MATYDQTTNSSAGDDVARRSAPFRPPIWDFNYVQSITTQYHQGEPYASQLSELKEKVRSILNDDDIDHLAKLEHVDMIQRLGFSYHFEKEIESIVNGLYNDKDTYKETWKDNLYATALHFRFLRQHQYAVSQEVFKNFKDDTSNNFKASIVNDVTGMLGLYEASFHSHPGEAILEEARDFTTKHLQEFVKNNTNDNNNNEQNQVLVLLVVHALDVPLHWRVKRFEARWFIDHVYSKLPNMIPSFLDLAILDFNMVQSLHVQELKELFRLWKDLGIANKCSFARNRVTENHLWTIGVTFEPQYKSYRMFVALWNALITILDDIYDTYGTLHELELLTIAFQRWDMSAMDTLPDYMKLCFLAIFNETNKLAYDILMKKGLLVIKHLKHWLVTNVRTYIQEAKWYYAKQMPAFDEYIENGWISIVTPAEIGVAYLFVANPITDEGLLEVLENYSSIVREASLVCRLTNDMSTSSFELEKGDVPKSIQCYMHETGATEEEACRHMRLLINEGCKLVNKELVDNQNSHFCGRFREIIINIVRSTFDVYHNRDGFGYETNIMTKDCAEFIYANSIPFLG